MKIFVTRKLPTTALERLSGHEMIVSEFDRPLTTEELLERAKGVDVLLSLLTDKIDGKVVDAIGPQLKIVSNYAVGFDNIKVDELTERKIIVTNTPCDEVNESVAEHTWALILALSRRIVEADEAVRRGAYRGWEPAVFLGSSLAGKKLGIIGMGRIGSMVAKRAKGFGMEVNYCNRSRDEKAESELGVVYCDMDSILPDSDIVTLHIPLTDETRHLINKTTLSKMKKGALLVNTARGPVADEGELVEFLHSGHLGGAALDVFENEPNVNAELIGMENVVLTPHIASGSKEAREKMGQLAVDAILDLFSNKKPQNIVNEEVWKTG